MRFLNATVLAASIICPLAAASNDQAVSPPGVPWSTPVPAATFGGSCGNDDCEGGLGEDCGTCPADCPCPPNQQCENRQCVPFCGNGECDGGRGEDCGTCAEDCPCPPNRTCENRQCVLFCGNGQCDGGAGEDCTSCEQDCPCPANQICDNHQCVPFCGNGQCNGAWGEDCTTCAEDCPCPAGQQCGNHQCVPFCGNGQCDGAAWGEDCGTCAQDCPCPPNQQCENQQCVPYCGNGQCDGGPWGEDCTTCANDCPCPAGQQCGNHQCVPFCGNGQCDGAAWGEDCGTCAQDCPCPPNQQCENQQCVPYCGNGQCDGGQWGEDCGTCLQDCPCPANRVCESQQCVPFCGNGDCDGSQWGEDCGTCLQDCPCPPNRICENQQCVPYCGNGDCDGASGEDCETCAADCPCPANQRCEARQCVPFCGNGDCDGSRWDEDCGTCPGDCPCPPNQQCENQQCVPFCGNNECDGQFGEDCGTCPGDCPCPPDSQCVDRQCISVTCGDYVCAPGREDCGTCPGDCPCPTGEVCSNRQCVPPQAECGDGVCQIPDGEDFESCPADCDPSCGDGQCVGTDPQTCPDDCICTTTQCPGGCAARPILDVSDVAPRPGQTVTFTLANPGEFDDPTPEWDFGDGTHCHDCPSPVTHQYTREGYFLANVTAHEPVCDTAPVSRPVAVNVNDYLTKGDIAEIVSHTLPGSLCTGSYLAQVTVRNVGATIWSDAAGYKLGAFNDSDPFTTDTRIELPPNVVVNPGESYTFEIPMTAPVPAVTDTTDWQMVREGIGWFGGRASKLVICDGAPPPDLYQYYCDATAHDGYGPPITNALVRFEAYYYEPFGGERVQIATRFGGTGPDGAVVVRLDADRLANELYCEVELGPKARGFKKRLVSAAPILNGRTIEVRARRAPIPNYVKELPGLKPQSRAVSRLYRAGAYDKVLVIAEPFNAGEQAAGPRDGADFWFELEQVLQGLNLAGFDVWLVNTKLTGQNIHEQAAEFAQAMEYAAVGYPAQVPSPQFGGRVLATGISLGGVVTRLSTARWDAAGAEHDAWRAALGLQRYAPIVGTVFLDAPLRGAVVSRPLQDFVTEPFGFGQFGRESQYNMNSCAFQQLVVDSKNASDRCNHDGSCHSRAFFEDGTEFWFDGGGTCDFRLAGVICRCDAGPAVFSLNGDGFPHDVGGRPITNIAYADASWTSPPQCYGDDRDWNRAKEDMCPRGPEPRPLYVGDTWMSAINNNCPDVHFRLQPKDVQPGSRQSNILDDTLIETDYIVCNEILLVQYSSPAFIPIASALATDAPGTCGVDECDNLDHSAGHISIGNDRNRDEHLGWVFGKISQMFGGSAVPLATISAPAVAQPGQGISFTGSATGETNDTLHVWDFGDGTVASGRTVTHAFDVSGEYPVTLTIVERGVITTWTQHSLVVGVPNAEPTATAPETQVVGVNQPVVLKATAHDPDGRIVRYHWSFGDGSMGSGSTVSHAYEFPGVYQVNMSAFDDEGASTHKSSTVVVGVPAAVDAVTPTGTLVMGSQRTFLWLPVAGAERYVLTIKDSKGTAVDSYSADPQSCGLRGCRMTLGVTWPVGPYSWGVNAWNSQGAGPDGQTLTFSVVWP